MSLQDTITVNASWDDEAKVWVATSDDIHGLALESESLGALRGNVIGAVGDLIELNGFGIPKQF